jgi:hypothetical protein
MAPLDYDEFLRDLYGCKFCQEQRRPFAIPTPDGRPRRGWNKFKHHPVSNAPHKFPPIGLGPRPLLFIGINPRFTDNSDLHAEVMSSVQAFKVFSENKVFGAPYIRPPSTETTEERETFYDDQQQIASAAFPDQPFAAVACSAEMYFCASADADGLRCGNSPCANQFLRRLIEDYVQPRVIVTFGTQIPRFFRKNLGGITASVVHLPFRSPWSAGRSGRMDAAVNWAARAAVALFAGTSVPLRGWTWPGHDSPKPVEDYSDWPYNERSRGSPPHSRT